MKRIEQTTLERAMIGDYDPKIAKLVLYGHGYREKDEDSPTVTIKIDSNGDSDLDKWSK